VSIIESVLIEALSSAEDPYPLSCFPVYGNKSKVSHTQQDVETRHDQDDLFRNPVQTKRQRGNERLFLRVSLEFRHLEEETHLPVHFDEAKRIGLEDERCCRQKKEKDKEYDRK
jgi:hypothetical protein